MTFAKKNQIIMEKLTKNFIEDPNEETFSLIEISSFALNEVFKHAPNLADQFFKFKHWHLLFRDRNSSQAVQNKMRDAIETFEDGFKYCYALNYNDRIAYEPELIKLASTVQELKCTHHALGNKYRKEIIEKMREVAVTEEEKMEVSRYEI